MLHESLWLKPVRQWQKRTANRNKDGHNTVRVLPRLETVRHVDPEKKAENNNEDSAVREPHALKQYASSALGLEQAGSKQVIKYLWSFFLCICVRNNTIEIHIQVQHTHTHTHTHTESLSPSLSCAVLHEKIRFPMQNEHEWCSLCERSLRKAVRKLEHEQKKQQHKMNWGKHYFIVT